jgi:hypothetical protein
MMESEERIRSIVTEVLNAERLKTETMLIEQEHRLVRVFLNLYEHWRSQNSELKRAAWLAALWRILSPRAGTVAIISGGLFGALLTTLGLIVALRANTLLERQNARMDIQNTLTESQRRSAYLASELASILLKIDAERADAKLPPDADNFVPSKSTIGRIVSLTLALRPYRPVEVLSLTAETARLQKADQYTWVRRLEYLADRIFPIAPETSLYKFSDRLISPERGQLLLSLIPQRLNFGTLMSAGANFDYADLSESVIRDANLSKIRLARSDLTGAALDSVILDNADLEYAVLRKAIISGGSLRGIRIGGAQLIGTQFVYAGIGQTETTAMDADDLCVVDGIKIATIESGSADLLNCNVKGVVQFEGSEQDVLALIEIAKVRKLSLQVCQRSIGYMLGNYRFMPPGTPCTEEETARNLDVEPRPAPHN